MVVYIATQAIKKEKVYTQGQLKLIHINFFIVNGYVTVICVTQKLEIAVLAFFKQENLL